MRDETANERMGFGSKLLLSMRSARRRAAPPARTTSVERILPVTPEPPGNGSPDPEGKDRKAE